MDILLDFKAAKNALVDDSQSVAREEPKDVTIRVREIAAYQFLQIVSENVITAARGVRSPFFIYGH